MIQSINEYARNNELLQEIFHINNLDTEEVLMIIEEFRTYAEIVIKECTDNAFYVADKGSILKVKELL